jgi:hypothetical protein
MSALDGITACVTAFRRPDKLKRCLESIRLAGIKNVSVAHGDEYGSDISPLLWIRGTRVLSHGVRRTSCEQNKHNRRLAYAFFEARGNTRMMAVLK